MSSSTDHLAADRALFVLSLEVHDPERRAAIAHAEGCERCRQLLQQSRGLLSMLDSGLAAGIDAEISASLEARVRAGVYKRPAPAWASIALIAGMLLSGLMAVIQSGSTAELALHIGGHCFFYEQAFAAGAFVFGAVFAKDYVSLARPWQAALVTTGGALLGQAILIARCPADGAALHLALFHVLGVAFAMGLGAVVGPRVARAR